mmetsp:Transcript_14814/g.35305  ORF Transcript_14814/g.35305 Transcript_14814/m.35305 type:complete len:730 (-) Transcript_14814:4846-7035(-)
MFWETVFFILWLSIFTALVITSTSQLQYGCRAAQLSYWSDCRLSLPERQDCAVDNIKDISSFWSWLTNDFTDLAWPFEYAVHLPPDAFGRSSTYQLNELSKPFSMRVLDDRGIFFLLGAIRVRQLRVRPNAGCKVSNGFRHAFPQCYALWRSSTESKRYFAKRWTPTYTLPAYRYRTPKYTKQSRTRGQYSTYGAGGFLFDLPPNKTDGVILLQDLREWAYLDEQTRAVIIELNVVNPHVNIIVNTRLLFELAPTGEIVAKQEAHALPVFFLALHAMAESDIASFSIQIFLVTFILLDTVYVGFLIKQGGLRYFGYGWNCVEVINLVLFYILIGLRIHVYIYSSSDLGLRSNSVSDPYEFRPYSSVIQYIQLYSRLIAFNAVLMWMKLYKYMALFGVFRSLIRALEHVVRELVGFLVLFFCVLFAYALALYGGFAEASEKFATLDNCFFSLFFMLLGKYELTPLYQAHRFFGPLLFFTFLLIVYFLLFNLVVAIVIDTYTLISVLMVSDQKHDPMLVFFYVYYHKVRGIDLFWLHAEELGGPGDQKIKLTNLPGVVIKKYLERSNKGHDKGYEVTEGPDVEDVDPDALEKIEVDRVQLQKLLDENPLLVQMLETDNAAKVIRRFNERAKQPLTEITELQERVYRKLERLEKSGIALEYSEVPAVESVRKGLSEQLQRLQAKWKQELADVLRTAAQASAGLIDLTKALENVQMNHNTLVRELASAEDEEA